MHFLRSLLTGTFLAAGAFAAKKTPEERFNDFHAKALTSSPIKLADTSYKSLTSAPRDYTVAVLLTALENRFGCQLCREFQPEWDLLGKTWTKGDKKGESRLLFGTLDFSDGREVFMSVGNPSPEPGDNGLGQELIRSLPARPPNRPRSAPVPAHHRSSRCCCRRSSAI